MLRLFGEYQDCAVGTSCPIDMGIFQYLYIVDVINRDVVDRLCLYAVYDIKGCGVAVDAFCSTDIHLAVATWIAVAMGLASSVLAVAATAPTVCWVCYQVGTVR